MTPVEVPKVGNTVEECMVGEWRKHKGDLVTAGEVIAEIETDKTTFEITAPVSGTILEVFFTQGSLVPVSSNLCVIGEMVLFCTVRALMEAPALNAEFGDGRIRRHAEVNLGFACDTDRGLLVPVVRECRKLRLAELSARVKQLAEQAVRGTIAADDLRGATFTVSNLGSLGIESFTPCLL